MDEEQTRLLQQLLDIHKEHLAFAKNQGEKLLSAQRRTVDGQKKAMKMGQVIMGLLGATMGLIAVVSLIALTRPTASAPAFVAGHAVTPAQIAASSAQAPAGAPVAASGQGPNTAAPVAAAKAPPNQPPPPPGGRYVTHSEE